MEAVVYSLSINVNGVKKRYIGSTISFETRVHQHLCKLLGRRHTIEQMQSDFDANGRQVLIGILAFTNLGRQHKLEHEFQVKYKTYDERYGYNYKDPALRAYRSAAGLPVFQKSNKGKTWKQRKKRAES